MRILIVGGGIAGLTLATALHQQGFTPELVERERTWHTVGAGIAVQPNGMRVLDALGMATGVEQAGTVIRWWSWCDQQGAVLREIDLEALWGDVAPFIGIARSELHRVLVAGAAAASCRLGTSVISLTQDGRRVSVGFSDGSAGEYDLVVGADGISSTVRALALSAASPTDLGAMNWRSIAPIRPGGLTALRFLLAMDASSGFALWAKDERMALGMSCSRDSTTRWRVGSNASVTASQHLATSYGSIWPPWSMTSRSTARPWSGSMSMSGTPAA
jgi:2-polyprenyl-6-methoxyphenol hydroxylase-like FAD-dependent oxidoreductase